MLPARQPEMKTLFVFLISFLAVKFGVLYEFAFANVLKVNCMIFVQKTLCSRLCQVVV